MEDECKQSERIGKCGERCFGYKRNDRVEKACCRQSRLRLMSIRLRGNKSGQMTRLSVISELESNAQDLPKLAQ
jgi:hypothetical protein